MKAYTFAAVAACTVYADTEAEARTLLSECSLDEDVVIGHASVYLASYDLASADLVDVYDLDDE